MLAETSCPLAYRNQLEDWTQAELSVCNIVISEINIVIIVSIVISVIIVIFINIVIDQ